MSELPGSARGKEFLMTALSSNWNAESAAKIQNSIQTGNNFPVNRSLGKQPYGVRVCRLLNPILNVVTQGRVNRCPGKACASPGC